MDQACVRVCTEICAMRTLNDGKYSMNIFPYVLVCVFSFFLFDFFTYLFISFLSVRIEYDIKEGAHHLTHAIHLHLLSICILIGWLLCMRTLCEHKKKIRKKPHRAKWRFHCFALFTIMFMSVLFFFIDFPCRYLFPSFFPFSTKWSSLLPFYSEQQQQNQLISEFCRERYSHWNWTYC